MHISKAFGRIILVYSIYVVCAFSQPTFDVTGAAKTSPFKRLADEPGRCAQGEYYENTVTGKLRRCTAINTWTDFPDSLGFELTTNKDSGSGYAGLTAGSLLKTAEFPAFTGDATTIAGNVAVTVVKINGTSVPTNAAADTLLSTSASAVAGWTAIPGCLDSAGNHLNYNTSTHAFSCGTTSSGGGGTVTSVSGTASQIASTGGATPVLSIASVFRFPGSYVGNQTITTFSATPSFDLSIGQSFKITLTGNVTSSTWTNLTAGERTTFLICQDATGSRTFAWPATAKGAMTIGSTLSTCNSQSFISDGTNLYAEAIGMVNM